MTAIPDLSAERYEALAGWADHDRKRRRENGERNPFVEAWKAEQRLLAEALGRCEERGATGLRCIRPVGHSGGCVFVFGVYRRETGR